MSRLFNDQIAGQFKRVGNVVIVGAGALHNLVHFFELTLRALTRPDERGRT